MENDGIIERRLFDRFSVSQSAIALMRPGSVHVGQIKEISKSGLVVQYFHEGEPSLEATEMDIMLSGSSEELVIERLPIKTVSDVDLTEDVENIGPKRLRRRAIAFDVLSPEQETEVGQFIRHFLSTLV